MKKLIYLIITLLAIFIVGYFVLNSGSTKTEKVDLPEQIIVKGEYHLLKKELSAKQLAACNKNQLSLIRNTIFARYGYHFNSVKLQEHFNKFNWYKPKNDDVDCFLTSNDKKNIQKILFLENQLNDDINKESEIKVLESKLVGLWHNNPMLAAGWGRKYLFYQNGHFRFDYADESERNISFSGDWYIIKNKLVLIKKNRVVIKGGKLEESPSGDNSIEGGITVKEKITPSQKIVYRLGIFEENHSFPHPIMVKINGIRYWKFFDDPKEYEKLYKDENYFEEGGRN